MKPNRMQRAPHSFYKERKRTQKNAKARSFIKNAKERKKRAFFNKECKRTQKNAKESKERHILLKRTQEHCVLLKRTQESCILLKRTHAQP